MFSRDAFLSTVAREVEIVKHLNDKLSGDQLTYRPAEGMRNTLELLQYLTFCAIGPAQALIDDDWTSIATLAAEAKKVTAASFGADMDHQLDAVTTLVSGLDAETLVTPRTMPWGEKTEVGRGLVDFPMRFLTAYRMQLFVYAKASGSAGLSTSNCWLGTDPAAPAG